MGNIEANLENQTVTGNVRDFASFALYPHLYKSTKGLQGRAEIGTHWHDTMRAKAGKNKDTKTDFEVTVDDLITHRKWDLVIRGRIDQVVHEPKRILIREIKTVNLELPIGEEILRNNYPEYFRQALLYQYLYKKKIPPSQSVASCVLFIDINTGISQTIETNPDDHCELDEHLEQIVDYFEKRKFRLQKLRKLELKAPFENWRDGQEEVRNQLKQKIEKHPYLFFQAPTGFGKTGLILEAALKRIQDGHIRRIFFLTSKTTGQLPIRHQLEQIGGPHSGLRHLVIRNQKDIDAKWEHPLIQHDEIQNIKGRWMNAGLEIESIYQSGTVSLDEIIHLSAQLGIPPRNLNQFLLPHSEIWIGDYNYIFDPSVRKSFLESLSYDPSETLLIVDEAHNLPSRTASSWSWTMEVNEVERVLTDIHFAKFSDALTRSLDQLVSWLKQLTIKEELSPPEEADLFEYLSEIDKGWRCSFLSIDDISEESQLWMWELTHALSTWSCGLPFHTYVRNKGEIRRECLDASSWIKTILEEHRQIVLMSATLHPLDAFYKSLGLSSKHSATTLIAQAPWQENAYKVIVDKRVDTRYTKREKSYPITARTILQIEATESHPMVVFFPSYRYAETIANYLKTQDPYVQLRVQPRIASFEEQEAFLEESLHFANIIFLIMGSRFSEGIDALGGRVELAMIVGPALPEVNPIQRAKLKTNSGNQHERFREVYQIPAMRKINQALGRLVRSPDHEATIILHCVRFAETSFLELLNPQCQPSKLFENESDFQSWLNDR